jgi:hypothetical protein
VRPVALRELMTVEVRVHPIVEVGGGRRFVAFEGGHFEGRDGLAGLVLPGGIDWQTVRPDGTLEIDAHYTLETGAHERIEVRSQGLRKASEAVTERIALGEAVDPDQYYFRTHVRFGTGATERWWLNDLLAVATGRRERDRVTVDIHEVL